MGRADWLERDLDTPAASQLIPLAEKEPDWSALRGIKKHMCCVSSASVVVLVIEEGGGGGRGYQHATGEFVALTTANKKPNPVKHLCCI